jgi:hypothetical protein
MNILAYTYLILNKINGKWYYGIRYAKGCNPSELFNTYFSSSKYVKNDIALYGKSNFHYEVRKTFANILTARNWEYNVLRRMKAKTRSDCYNQNEAPHPPIMFGNENPSKRLDVRLKLKNNALRRPKEHNIKIQIILLIKRIVILFKTKDFVIAKSKVRKYNNMLTYVRDNKPCCSLIIRKLEELIYQCNNIKRKEYPKNRKKGIYTKERNKKISLKNKGKIYYTSPCLTEVISMNSNDNPPEGWIKGNKLKERNEKISISSKRKHTDESKKKMSNIAKKRIYCTSPCLQILKIVYNSIDIPEGWIRGNKLKSRNIKISNYLKNERWSDHA